MLYDKQSGIEFITLPKRVNELKDINDFVEGDIKPHIIKWHKEDDSKFKWRQRVSYYQDYVNPIVNGLTGMIFSKEHVINVDEVYEVNIDLIGTNIYKFMQTVTKNAIKDGICFIVSDTNSVSDNNSLADTNLRGYLKQFEYLQLQNYKIKNGKLVQIVFKEIIQVDNEVDEYATKDIDRFIRYFIGGGEIYHKDKGMELVHSWTNNLDEIPINMVYGGFDNIGLDVQSILLKITNLNKAHLNLKSGLMNISHIASNPTPVMWGSPSNVDKGTLALGVNAVLTFPTNQGNAYDFQWREITGKGVEVAEREIKSLEDYIISSSFNILKVDKFTTATEARLNSGKNKSILTSIAKSLESGMISSLEFLELLTNTKILDELILNKDFDNLAMNAETINSLINLRNNGNISLDTLWDALIEGELIKIDDKDLEKDKLQNELALGL